MINAVGIITDVIGNLKFVDEMARQVEGFLRTAHSSTTTEVLCQQLMFTAGIANARETLQVEGIDALDELVARLENKSQEV
jgi:hypothetical protein